MNDEAIDSKVVPAQAGTQCRSAEVAGSPPARGRRGLTRRAFLATGGALVVGFTLRPLRSIAQTPAATTPELPASLKKTPLLDAWIRINADGTVTVFTGKAELGQGVTTALQQIAAEQLSVPMSRITMVAADTGETPDEGYTAGSNSLKDSGTALLNASAQVREILIAQASQRLGVASERLVARDGAIVADDGRRLGFGEIVAGQMLHVNAEPRSKLKDRASHTVMGKPVPRLDIPRKVTGGVAYVQDLRLPGMVHARVVRPPAPGARLKSLDTAAASKMSGVLNVVRNGRFVAVVADDEFRAIRAMRAIADSATWEPSPVLPAQAGIHDYLQRLPSQDSVIRNTGDTAAAGGTAIEATYRRPYQMHGAIGPSCAVAQIQDGRLTIWTHTQGVFPLRAAIAELVAMPPERIRCIHLEGAGCYGHNGADDAAADAALIALAIPGKPVRVQYMREQEHTGEPFGAAMIGKARATLDSGGKIASWQYEVWSNTHSMRPGKAGHLAAAQLIETPFAVPAPQAIPQPEGGGDRNAIPLYAIANTRVVHHFIPEMPIRVSALRALGAYTNVFAIESFVDELALAAKADPVEFRLKHLEDPRARDVIRAAAEQFGWTSFQRAKNHGRGFAFARYKNLAAYCAIALEVEVERETGEVRIGRVASACDSGAAVNPDGIRNQIEGGIVQSLSWTMFEAVAWDSTKITSRDWSSYPIMRFGSLPKSIEVRVIDRPDQPFLGTGEAAQGPAGAALANAIADATGRRIRDIPLDRARIKSALGA